MTIEEASKHVGDCVVYTDGCGLLEDGVITSVNHKNVFVRYGSDIGSKATSPEDLKFRG